uniref:Uncharacterized protein n=1 Tax=uncultured Verrucomicrobiales bacterium HF0010_05E02 TaxID=710995 RepID=E0XQP5_9BACT|nr:hypothetical protein [uncultured Verrucomicrobiales bacterium HF0010_05E02]
MMKLIVPICSKIGSITSAFMKNNSFTTKRSVRCSHAFSNSLQS